MVGPRGFGTPGSVAPPAARARYLRRRSCRASGRTAAAPPGLFGLRLDWEEETLSPSARSVSAEASEDARDGGPSAVDSRSHAAFRLDRPDARDAPATLRDSKFQTAFCLEECESRWRWSAWCRSEWVDDWFDPPPFMADRRRANWEAW